MILGYVFVAGIVNPWVFIPTVPLIVVFLWVRHYYLATSRDIKRLEGTSKSILDLVINSAVIFQ